VYLVLFYWCRE